MDDAINRSDLDQRQTEPISLRGRAGVLVNDREGSWAPMERKESSGATPVPLRYYGASVLIVLATLGCALLLRALEDLPDLEMLFLLAVMISAVWFGRGPALAAAALGTTCYDFFLVPPYHTLWVHDRTYFLTFGMMFGVGLVMSELTERLRRHERDAVTREKRTGVLYALTKELASTNQASEIATIATHHAADAFAARVVLLVPNAEGELDASPTIHDDDIKVARWCFEHGELAGLGADTWQNSDVVCAPLRSSASRFGVLVLAPNDKRALPADQRTFLDVFCQQLAAALERARLAEEARLTALRVKAEEMRSTLLSAVSHDLRTPLATITGAATTLRDEASLSRETRVELIESIVDQAERLERLVSNLLDMTRLDSGALVLRKDWIPLDEVIGSALTRLEKRLEQRRISIDLGDDVPLVLVDPVLIEQLLVNLLENAEKHTPATASIEVHARVSGESVILDVLDDGPGIPPGAQQRIFEKFYRGPHVGRVGAGLGLAICRGIAEAHGGQIIAENREPRGAAFHVSIPRGNNPPILTAPVGGMNEC